MIRATTRGYKVIRFEFAHARIVMGAIVLILSLLSGTAGGAEFTFGSYLVKIEADDSAIMTTTDYQITVENEDLILTRLTAPYTGTLSTSYVADLDKDGNFEVVVTSRHDAGRETAMRVFSWNGQLLEPVTTAPLPDEYGAGYRGGDEFVVDGGHLVRIFQVHEAIGDAWQPTAAVRRLRYSFQDSTWTPAP